MTVIALKAAAKARAKPRPVDRLPGAASPIEAVTANVSLDLFRRAAVCRYPYVLAEEMFKTGVLIEPCPHGGVIMVSTDGARLIAIRDAGGSVSERTLVRADDEDEIRSLAGLDSDARLVIADGVMTYTSEADDEEFGGARLTVRGWRMDCPFPDWRQLLGTGALADGPPPPCNPRLLKKIGRALNSDPAKQGSGAVRLQALAEARPNVPADAPAILVTAGGGSSIDGFGLVMPVAAPEGGYVLPALPGWALKAEG